MFLNEILHIFDSQLSQEQAWSVCYMSAIALSSQRRENLLKRKNVRYLISMENVQINPTGRVSFLLEEDSQPRQQEKDIIRNLGNVICRCLDYGLDATCIDGVNFEPDMAELIAGMVLNQFNENDEGYEDEPMESFSRKSHTNTMRSFRSLDEVYRFCEARLLRKNIETGGEHYRNVLKAIYVEANELKTFLDHVTPSLRLASESERCKLNPGAASTAVECVYEWARFWLQVMHELRRGVHLRKVTQAKISPLEYEYSPYEIASEGAISSVTVSKPNIASGLPDNAGNIILDFILSRQAKGVDDQTDYGLTEDSDNEIFNLPLREDYVTDHRRALRVQSPLWSKVDNWDWDASQDSLLSDDLALENNRNYWKEPSNYGQKQSLHKKNDDVKLRRNSFDGADKKLKLDSLGNSESQAPIVGGYDYGGDNNQPRRRRSADFGVSNGDALLRVDDKPTQSQGNLGKTKKRLAVSMMCLTDISLDEDPRAVGTSLFEISKIRRAITVAETEALTNRSRTDLFIKNGKICFACRKTKFSLIQKSRECEICEKRFCAKCMVSNVEVPDHLVHLKTDHDVDKSQRSLSMTSGLSKSLGNLNFTTDGCESVTPFPCKRQSILRMTKKKTYGGKIIDICKDCKSFLDSIIVETKNTRWHVGMAMDI